MAANDHLRTTSLCVGDRSALESKLLDERADKTFMALKSFLCVSGIEEEVRDRRGSISSTMFHDILNGGRAE